MQTMYPAIVNSPETVTKGALTNSTTTIEVADASIFTAVGLPIPLTLGQGSSAETVLLTAVSGNILTITRGFQGVARAWEAGTSISRNFTAYDHDAFKANIAELSSGKADKTTGLTGYIPKFKADGNLESSGISATSVQTLTGAATNNTVAFTAATARANLTTGEKISISFGKLMKWFTDLEAHYANTTAHMTAGEKTRLNASSTPNALIDGNFQIWSNGTSLTINGTYGPDMWRVSNLGYVNADKISNGIKLTSIEGEVHYSNLLYQQQRNFGKYQNQVVTISAKFRKSRADLDIRCTQYGGETTVLSTNTTNWQTYVNTITTTSDFTGVTLQGYGIALNDWVEVEYIKLELGTIATPCYAEPYDEALRRIASYYIKVSAPFFRCPNFSLSSRNWCEVVPFIFFPQKMSSAPTVVIGYRKPNDETLYTVTANIVTLEGFTTINLEVTADTYVQIENYTADARL